MCEVGRGNGGETIFFMWERYRETARTMENLQFHRGINLLNNGCSKEFTQEYSTSLTVFRLKTVQCQHDKANICII